MNIVFGLCGEGSRFKLSGFEYPKFLNICHGAPMIYHAVKTVKIPGKIYFVVRDDYLKNYKHLEKLLLALGDEIVVSKGKTEGAAQSLLLTKPYIKNLEEPFLSVNCDQYLSWDPADLIDKMQKESYSNFIITYKERSPKCSYIREKDGLVIEVREKKVISNDATIGLYHWAHTRDFFQDAEQMITDNYRENNEFYVAPVYNYSIQRGLVVKKYPINNSEFWPLGTPYDYRTFTLNNSDFD